MLVGDESFFIVKSLSNALIPVLHSFASTLMVKAVEKLSLFESTIGFKSNLSAISCVMDTQIRPLPLPAKKFTFCGVEKTPA